MNPEADKLPLLSVSRYKNKEVNKVDGGVKYSHGCNRVLAYARRRPDHMIFALQMFRVGDPSAKPLIDK